MATYNTSPPYQVPVIDDWMMDMITSDEIKDNPPRTTSLEQISEGRTRYIGRRPEELIANLAKIVKTELDIQRNIDNEHTSRLNDIERRLFILHDRDIRLENEYEELRTAYNEYRRIEEKLKVFEKLKENTNV